MQIRALILLVVLSGWLIPAAGWPCALDTQVSAPHVHSADADSGSHSHTGPDHSHAERDHNAGHSHDSSTTDTNVPSIASDSHSSRDDATCCNPGAETPIVVGLFAKAESHPTLSTPQPLAALTTLTPYAVDLRNEAHVRQQLPPPQPFARTRRPLLI